MASPTQPIESFPPLTPIRPPMAASRLNPESFTGKRAATRHRLLDAAAQLIVRDGFDAVSMTAVAEEAGITRQTVYRYFPNARELVRATLMRGGRDLLEGQILVFQSQGDPRALLVEAVMAALGTIRHNPLLRTAWASRDYPQEMLRSVFDPAFTERGVEGLAPIARQLGWSEGDTREAYEIIARTVLSFLTIPPPEHLSDETLRGALGRRLLPALGVSA
ncbi:MAG: helix-turn-helix domain-containing protein [Myxococcota bacterium]